MAVFIPFLNILLYTLMNGDVFNPKLVITFEFKLIEAFKLKFKKSFKPQTTRSTRIRSHCGSSFAQGADASGASA